MLTTFRHPAFLMVEQQWFRWWLGTTRQQAISWSIVDHGLSSYGFTRLQWVNVVWNLDSVSIKLEPWGIEGKLTLHMLTCFKNCKRFIYILYQVLEFVHIQDQIHNRANLHVTYPILSLPCLLMPCNTRSQGISRHGIDSQRQNIPSPASEQLTML